VSDSLRPGEVGQALCALEAALVHLGRYKLVQVLVSPKYEEKSAFASSAVSLLDAAARVAEFNRRSFHTSAQEVFWHKRYNPARAGLLSESHVDRPQLAATIAQLSRATLGSLEKLKSRVQGDQVISSCAPLLEDLHRSLALLGAASMGNEPSVALAPARRRRKCVHQAFRGPRQVGIDDRFVRSYSLLDVAAPGYSESLRDAVPYYWTLSTREAMACDSCALSAIEYDDLPLMFYRDMAKQAWDEARHAVLFLDLSRQLMPALLDELHDKQLRTVIVRFIETERGLPIPLEGNLYEVMWNSELAERLVLMQIETEAAAVPALKRRGGDQLCRRFSILRWAMDVDRNDEISHARIGHTWVRFLIPVPAERKEVILASRSLRPIFMADAFAQNGNSSVLEIVADVAAGKRLPIWRKTTESRSMDAIVRDSS
jgi:hypothetical protein